MGAATAPTIGRIARVEVKPGDAVSPNQPLVVIESMKMETVVRAVTAGVVKKVVGTGVS